jgi:serine protease Do
MTSWALPRTANSGAPYRASGVALLAIVFCCWSAHAEAEQTRGRDAALIRNLLPSVVNITSRKTADEPTLPATTASAQTSSSHVVRLSGSGFIIDPQGIIVTNYHVIDGAFEISVTFEDGSRALATLVAAAQMCDIALLKVNVGYPLPATRWGNSDQVQIGDPVLAVGNPLGIGMSVTSGIVSALNRNIMASPFDDFIQTDASINHGNSGGPLFGADGEVIGIDTALYSPTTGSVGLGFAIPANDAQFAIAQLLRYGELRAGWIGICVQGITPEIAAARGMKQPQGSIVSIVVAGSPAAKAGLTVGDVILGFGSERPGDPRSLMRDIAKTPAGTTGTVAIWRAGREQELPITVAEWPNQVKLDTPAAPVVTVPPDFGLQLATLDDESRAKFDVHFHGPGVLVTGVAANSDAAERGLIAGDVILRVEDRPVTTPAEVQKQLDEARAQKRIFVLVLVQPTARASEIPAAQAAPLWQGQPAWLALRGTAASGNRSMQLFP